MQEEKRFYRWCMYGNYHPDFELKPDEPFLGSLRRLCLQVNGFLSKVFKISTVAVFVAVAGIFGGCKQQEVVVEKEKLVYVTKDSIVHRDSTVFVPYEVYRDYSRLTDTLVMSTSLATAKAWADTSEWILNGIIENKQAFQYKYIEVERIVTNDSIVEREKPVPYEVEVTKTRIPTWAWICLLWTVATIISICYSIYKKFF